MKIIIQRNSVAFIALLYNYFANDKVILSEDKVLKYIEVVYDNLNKLGFQYDVIDSDENYGINFYKYYKEYALESFENIKALYNSFSKELITASLQKNSLREIGVNVDELCYQKKYRDKPSKKTLYSESSIITTFMKISINIEEMEIAKQLLKIRR